MVITVKVKTGSKKPGIKKLSQSYFVVSVSENPSKGEANDAVIDALSDYLGVPKSRLTIKRGKTSKTKYIEVT